jgi:hypothetical protein
MAKKTTKKTIGDTIASTRRRGVLPPLKMTTSLQTSIRSFETQIALGFSDETWENAVYLLSEINQEAPLGVVEKLGSIWADAYIDPSNVHDRVEALLREHYPASE